MTSSLQLEDLGITSSDPCVDWSISNDRTGEKTAFDQGYRSGWNDASEEAVSSETKIRSEISIALQELGFTYFEARQHVMRSLKPLIDAMIETVIPVISDASFLTLLQQELLEVAERVETPLTLSCAPANAAELQSLIDKHTSLSVEVKPERTLAASQVLFQHSDGIAELDISEAVKRIQSVVDRFFAVSLQEGEACA